VEAVATGRVGLAAVEAGEGRVEAEVEGVVVLV
jgi:hypothetical protein